jgi:hypothetical protein
MLHEMFEQFVQQIVQLVIAFQKVPTTNVARYFHFPADYEDRMTHDVRAMPPSR